MIIMPNYIYFLQAKWKVNVKIKIFHNNRVIIDLYKPLNNGYRNYTKSSIINSYNGILNIIKNNNWYKNY